MTQPSGDSDDARHLSQTIHYAISEQTQTELLYLVKALHATCTIGDDSGYEDTGPIIQALAFLGDHILSKTIIHHPQRRAA